jgi:hypothetical protein
VLAYDFSIRHEHEYWKSDDVEKAIKSRMDLHNNGIGYDIGVLYADDYDDEQMCEKIKTRVTGGKRSTDTSEWIRTQSVWLWRSRGLINGRGCGPA